jgi:soluble lytic murein transglycosylase-like protein
MSTLSGILFGIAAAAAVTVFYGDTVNRKLGKLMRVADVTVSARADTLETVAAMKLQQHYEPTPVEPLARAEIPADESPDSALALKWQEFSRQSESTQAVGEFQWRDCFQRAAASYGISEALLLAIASGESGFDPAARSDKNAVGLMQIRWPQTSRHLGIHREADLYDPCTNVSAGARYLAELTARYGNDLHRAVAAYNYGPGRIGQGPLPQGAQWYSQYIYQHLQQVLDRPHIPSSELLPAVEAGTAGYEVVMRFNQPYRARDFMDFLQTQEPEITLARRTEALGRYEVILLYQDKADRQRALDAIERSGLVTLNAIR